MHPELETVLLDGDRSIKSLHYTCRAFQEDHNWHYHPECELSYIVKGAGTRFVGDSVEHFKAGDLVFIGPNIPHCWVSDEEHADNEMMVLQFSPACLGQAFLDTPEAAPLKSLYDEGKRGIFIQGDEVENAKDLLIKIASSPGLQRISYFILLLDVLCKAKNRHLLTTELYLADNSEFNGGRLGKVMNFVKDNLSNEIKQIDVAELVCMTPQSFSRFFRATTGRTFVAFVNILRITEASRLLVNSNKDITEIAFECGYCNLSNFNRRFSEIKSCTPTEYRAQHKKISQSS